MGNPSVLKSIQLHRRHPLPNPRYFVSPPYGGVIRFAWPYSHRGIFYYYFYNNKRSDSFFLL